MQDFDVSSPARRCRATDREFAPGEAIYSCLVREETQIVRRDVGPEVWTGPPDGCVAWWKSVVPHPTARKIVWAPDEAALHYLESLTEPEHAGTRYVLALALMRKRILRYVRSDVDSAGVETMRFLSSPGATEYDVVTVEPSPEEIESIQRALAENLGMGVPTSSAAAGAEQKTAATEPSEDV